MSFIGKLANDYIVLLVVRESEKSCRLKFVHGTLLSTDVKDP